MWIPSADGTMKVARPAPTGRKLTPAYRAQLQSEAPETLVKPTKEQFSNGIYYRQAMAKFKAFGHWATE